MIKWNDEYQVYVSDDGRVFNKKMKEYKLHDNKKGYLFFQTTRNRKIIRKRVHRLVYETFVDQIPEGYELDHINRVRSDNRLENIRIVTKSENCLNRSNNSEFGRKYVEHFGYGESVNRSQYNREYQFYKKHGKCCWEKLKNG